MTCAKETKIKVKNILNMVVEQALHPLWPEEILGLQWQDIDFAEQTIRIERAVTHPNRNALLLKGTKTDASRLMIDLAPQIIPYLTRSIEEHFVLGGDKPLSYTQTRKCASESDRTSTQRSHHTTPVP